jgi:hypothetical protein
MSSVSRREIIDQIPITEKEISRLVGRAIKSPVRLARLRDLDLDEDGFLAEHASIFEELSWDNYDVRRERLEILEEAFPGETTVLRELFPSYYLGEADESIYSDWTNRLNDEQRNRFDQVEPWRRRSVATFVVDEDSILREPPSGFSQAVDESDIRSLPLRNPRMPMWKTNTSSLGFEQSTIWCARLDRRQASCGCRLTS